eukprot:gene9045-10681_t
MDLRAVVSNGLFPVLIVAIVVVLYRNSLYGGFIWDDRAAVVKNDDVHGLTPFSSLFVHDFWGTDITRNDSHKSYRPLTVATFRLDFSFHALDAYGYHLSNIVVYATTCLLVYALISQWLSVKEAVASIVGRADALCGLFYCAALYCYTLGVRMSLINPRAVLTIIMLGLGFVFAALSTLAKEIGFTVLGVFVVIEIVEQLKCVVMRSQYYKEVNSVDSGTRSAILTKYSFVQSVCMIGSALLQCVTSLSFLSHIATIVVTACGYMKFRAQLHGETMLYKWTMMENHVLYLPTLYERSLSYALYHYMYLFKLVYPMELCFDYGYACIPTVHSIYDSINLLPLLAYTSILSVVFYSIYHLRINLMIGIVLLVVPLVPALNAFVAVGTLLAERLLFIPSIGFCIIVGELCSVDVPHLQSYIVSYMSARTTHVNNMSSENVGIQLELKVNEGQSTPKKGSKPSALTPPSPTNASSRKDKRVRFNSNDNAATASFQDINVTPAKKTSSTINTPEKQAMSPVSTKKPPVSVKKTHTSSKNTMMRLLQENLIYVLLLPVCYYWGGRVISRNDDWHNEYSLYKSGLDVCPKSLKVLTNFAVLAMARGEFETALDVALRATEIYPDQVAALINAGVAYQKLGRYAESVAQFQRCLEVSPRQGKAAGYMGVSYFHWAQQQSSNDAAQLLRDEALKYFLQAIQMGFQAPAILHLAGSTLIDSGNAEEAVHYYDAALRQSANYASYYSSSTTVPILLEDDVNPINTLNQLGSAYRSLGRLAEAISTYEQGLRGSPTDVPTLTNLANLYREQGEVSKARDMMQVAIQQCGEDVPPALLNNLGLLELNTGNFGTAKDLFQRALLGLQVEITDGGMLVGAGGGSAEETIRMNIRRAEAGLVRV